MTTPAVEAPPTRGFAAALESGLLGPEPPAFPEQDAADRAEGDATTARLDAFLRARLDPDRVDLTGELPEGFLDDLRASGFLKLRLGPEAEGLGLSPYNTFRAVEHAAGLCMPAGQMLAVQAGVGAPALVPALPEGPLRDHLTGRLADGAVSGFALTEPAGQNNAWPGTTATPAADGASYVLRGEKVFTGHGPVADLLAVAATEHTVEGRRLCVCFVDTSAAGFEVTSSIEFAGSRGLPNGALRLDGVRVPAEHVVRGAPEEPRFSDRMADVLLDGQLYFTGAPALAIARLCRSWSAEFLARRSVNGRALIEYDAVQRLVARTLAEVHAVDSVIRWALIGPGAEDRWFERLTAKNLAVRTAWRIVDRTVSLYGAEGVETVPSKLRRGAPPVPLERRMRDARSLRIAGNVDFQLDAQAGRRLLTRYYATTGDAPAAAFPGHTTGGDGTAGLTGANRAHLTAVREQVARFHETCAALVKAHPEQEELFEKEHTLILLGRIGAELFAMYAVLARAAQARPRDEGGGEGAYADAASGTLAEVYCVEAGHRLADLWRRLDTGPEPDYAGLGRRWLAGCADRP
ncbi:acyl-CoA dehydrogenase family protein [Streptomyces sp. NPDC047981]|uniref:acyl-CoA dehydrogenase family protein n=1 Tax=Streptomyces sp. NPDC047981 TaxID=3154610 RepID=UPI0034200267